MSVTTAMIWFIGTTAFVTGLMVLGIYEAAHSYSTRPHRHRHRVAHRH